MLFHKKEKPWKTIIYLGHSSLLEKGGFRRSFNTSSFLRLPFWKTFESTLEKKYVWRGSKPLLVANKYIWSLRGIGVNPGKEYKKEIIPLARLR